MIKKIKDSINVSQFSMLSDQVEAISKMYLISYGAIFNLQKVLVTTNELIRRRRIKMI